MRRIGNGYRVPPQYSSTPPLQRSGSSYPYIGLFEVLEGLHEIHRETRGDSAVDHAMVIGKAQRQHQSWLDLVVADDGLHRPAAQTKDGHLRLVHNRRELP